MTRNLFVLTCLILFVALSGLLSGCESKDTSTDGDTQPDGDTPDGDSSDGDDTDGDVGEDGDTPDGDADGDKPADGDVPSDGDTPEDGDLPVDGDDCDGVILTTASGQVIDGSGASVQGAVALVCLWSPEDRAVCLQPSMTNASGVFNRDIPPSNACVDRAAVRLLNTADLTWTQLACPYAVGEGGDVVLSEPARLVSVGEVAERDELGDPASPHRITSAAGTQLIVTPNPGDLIMYDGGYEDLRLMDWDAQTHGWPCFINPSDPPDGLVALVPELQIKTRGTVHIAFANTTELAAGTTVTLYGMGGAGTYTWDGHIVEEGEWEPIGQATVTEDGTKIRSIGDGLPFYTWVGWKAP